MASGLLILDNNAFGQLVKPEAVARLHANMRAADLIVQPTEVNLLEITAAPEKVRERLLSVLRSVAPGMGLLPWPIQLLQGVGHAILEGKPIFSAEPSGSEWYLSDSGALGEIHGEVLAFNRRIEEAFSELHDGNRKKVRDQMRREGTRDEFGSAREFLERHWIESELRRTYAEVTWAALDLPGTAPIAALERNEAWRLMLDAEGVAVYERAVADERPKAVGRMDLLQLVYLAGARKRILATSDVGLLRAGASILPGRYPNARVVPVATIVE